MIIFFIEFLGQRSLKVSLCKNFIKWFLCISEVSKLPDISPLDCPDAYQQTEDVTSESYTRDKGELLTFHMMDSLESKIL